MTSLCPSSAGKRFFRLVGGLCDHNSLTRRETVGLENDRVAEILNRPARILNVGDGLMARRRNTRADHEILAE